MRGGRSKIGFSHELSVRLSVHMLDSNPVLKVQHNLKLEIILIILFKISEFASDEQRAIVGKLSPDWTARCVNYHLIGQAKCVAVGAIAVSGSG